MHVCARKRRAQATALLDRAVLSDRDAFRLGGSDSPVAVCRGPTHTRRRPTPWSHASCLLLNPQGLGDSDRGRRKQELTHSSTCHQVHAPTLSARAPSHTHTLRLAVAHPCSVPRCSPVRLLTPRHLPSRARVRSTVSASPLAQLSFSAWAPAGILWAILSIPLVALTTLVGLTPPPELPTADMSGQVCVPPLAMWLCQTLFSSTSVNPSPLCLYTSFTPPSLLCARRLRLCSPPMHAHTPCH